MEGISKARNLFCCLFNLINIFAVNVQKLACSASYGIN